MKGYLKLNGRMGFLTVVISSIIILSVLQLNTILCKADLESEKAVFLTLINQYRQQNGLPPLSISSALTTAAQLHSEDMAINNYFSHTSLDGRTFVDRIKQAGYTYNTWLGENIAWVAANQDISTAQVVFNAWKNSPGHNANMLNSNFKVIGIGLSLIYNGTHYKWYWTTNFGGYDDSGGSPPSPPPSINNPPSKPAKPSGPLSGYVNESYAFKTSSVDPDGDLVSYTFDWGDGELSTTEYVASGTLVSLNHSWSKPGNYSVKVMAKDIRGASSSWSFPTVIQITIPLVEVIFTSNIPSVKINVDGVDYHVPKTFSWLKGTLHNVSLGEFLQFTDGGRYCFKGWSDGVKNKTRVIIVNNTISLTAIYETQYLIFFKTQPGNFTSEWYAAGTVISLSVEPILIANPGERLVFQGWSNNASDTTIEITVNEPISIEARWSRQFLLKLNSPYGDLNGEGWYNEGSIVNFSIYPRIIELENCTRRVFESWIGEGLESYSGIELNQTIVIRSPVNERAVWRTEYYLNVSSEYGEVWGGGWYVNGSYASFGVKPPPPSILVYVFEKWEGDENIPALNATILMNAPKKMVAKWSIDYTRLIIIGSSASVPFIVTILYYKYKRGSTTRRQEAVS